MGTADEPFNTLIRLAREEEAKGMLAATVFGGFPLADFADAGMSAICVGDGDREAASAAARRLMEFAWEQRQELLHRPEPLAEGVAGAKAINTGPVVLLDHADNVGSGGTGGRPPRIPQGRRPGPAGAAVGAGAA